MKRTILLLNALLLVGAFTGCSTNTTDSSAESIPDMTATATEPPVATTENTPTMIDVFDQAEITVNEGVTYPYSLSIRIESTSPDFSSHIFSVDVTRADLEKIEYTISVNEEYKPFAYYLEQNNYAVAETSKTFVVETKNLDTYLISEDLLTQESIEMMNESMKGVYLSDLGMTPIKSYAVIPNEDTVYSVEDDTQTYYTGDNFEDAMDYRLYTIFKCNLGYCVLYVNPHFTSEQQFITEKVNRGVIKFDDSKEFFQTEEEAYDVLLSHVENRKSAGSTRFFEVNVEY